MDATNAQLGGEIKLTLFWQLLTPLTTNYQVFAHLVREDIQGQHDSAPECGINPTTRWEPGQIIPDTHIIPIPPDISPGQSTINIGMYELNTRARLPLEGSSKDFLTLTDVFIEP